MSIFTGGGVRSGSPKRCPAYITVIRNFIHKRGTAGRTLFLFHHGRGCCRSCAGPQDLYRGASLQRGTAFVTKNRLLIEISRSASWTDNVYFFRNNRRQSGPAFITKGRFIIGSLCPAFRAKLNHPCLLSGLFLITIDRRHA